MLAPKGIKWDKTAEVVVVGYGLAGAVAAIAARDKGASVIIVEKQSANSHCSCSSMAGGGFASPSDIDGAAEYMKALCQVNGQVVQWTDLDTIRALAEYSSQNKNWIEKLGGKVEFFPKKADHPQLPGADSIAGIWNYEGGGFGMMQFMYEQVNLRNIEVLYQTPAKKLLTNEGGQIIGVRATDTHDGQRKEVNVMASKAVILCSGGFENNEEMKLQYLPVYPAYPKGGTANTGDGIKMAQEVGADLWHMNCVSAELVGKFPDFPIAFDINFSGGEQNTAGFIIVDKYGRRYKIKNPNSHDVLYEVTSFDTHKLEYPKVPSYFIFDRRRMECRRSLCQRRSGPAGPHQLYKWSLDNMAEVQKGWIVSAKTVIELAGKIAVPPPILEDTVQHWNKYCEEGNDPEFGRDPLELIPLDSPPFYAIKVFPGLSSTQGGPKRNMKGQVVNPFGDPVPGLYGAGECGAVLGKLYPVGGSSLGQCIASGRIAADNAVLERTKR